MIKKSGLIYKRTLSISTDDGAVFDVMVRKTNYTDDRHNETLYTIHVNDTVMESHDVKLEDGDVIVMGNKSLFYKDGYIVIDVEIPFGRTVVDYEKISKDDFDSIISAIKDTFFEK